MEGMSIQTSDTELARERRDEPSEREDHPLLRFEKFNIAFQDGVEPVRLRTLVHLLKAVAGLVDDTVWEDNLCVLDALPAYCQKCSNFGHLGNACPHFHGQVRTEMSFMPHERHVEGLYRFRRLGCTLGQERVIEINGVAWVVKEATGVDNNCLIDALRQVLKPDGLTNYEEYLGKVRRDLATKDFATAGRSQVRDVGHQDGANFLEFGTHTNKVVERLVQHAIGIDRRAACWCPEKRKFVCIDLQTQQFDVDLGSEPGAIETFIARENGNHFLPLRKCDIPDGDLLPWGFYVPPHIRRYCEKTNRERQERVAEEM